MSASSKKKLRKEQEAAAMTQKQQAAAKEAKKLKAYTITFWVVLALCVSLVAGLALKGPVVGVASRMTTALVVGEHKVSALELNYFYVDAINEFVNQYGSYLQLTGLNTAAPLSSQVYDKTAGTTWADHFLTSAISSAKNTYALYDAAVAAGHKLSEEETKAMNTLYDNMDVYAKAYGHSNANAYLKAIYGDGANKKTYKAYYEIVIMASSYYAAYSEQLKDSYTDVNLRDFEGKEGYKYNSYTYYYYYMGLDKFKFGGKKNDKGQTEYSEAEVKAAEEYIEKVAKLLSDPEINTLEKLNNAIAEMEKQLALDKAEAEKKPEDNNTEQKPEDNKPEETPEESKPEETPDASEPTETPDASEPTETPDASEPTTAPESEAQTVENDNVTEETPEDDNTEDDNTEDDNTEDDNTEDDNTEDDKTEDDKTEDKEDDKKYSKATEVDDQLYSKINALMQEWLRDTARKEGDITALKSTTKETKDGKEVETLKGYYIVMYKSVNDNKYALANVRHILVKFEGGTTDKNTGKTTYSQAEKDAAKKEATRIYDEWLKGAKTEDSFAELAKKYTDDGNGDEGGLYKDIVPEQMVATFNDWCFDEARKAGDHGTVETEYGWHVMFYSGDSETNYRDYMVTNDLLAKDMEAWQKALVDAISLTEKNTKFVNKDYIISSSMGM